MNRIYIVIVFFAFITHNSVAQNIALDTINQSPTKNTLIYLSMTSAFENYSSFDMGFSKTIQNGNAIGMELGYIYDIDALNAGIPDSWYQKTYGAKAYFYYRIFLNENDPYPRNSKTFIDFEPQLYWASFVSERIAGYSCNEQWGDCEYYRFFDSRVARIVPGLNLKLGKIYEYDPFHFILFMGVGMRHIVEFSEMMNDPVPDKIFDKTGQISDLQTGTLLNLRIGFQVAYKFWK